MAIRSRGANLKTFDSIMSALAESWRGKGRKQFKRIPSAQQIAEFLPRFTAWGDLWERCKRVVDSPLAESARECSLAVTAEFLSLNPKWPETVPMARLYGTIGTLPGGQVRDGYIWHSIATEWTAARVRQDCETLHAAWLHVWESESDDSARAKLAHPVELLFLAWLASGVHFGSATVNVVNKDYVRRPRTVSRMLQAPWSQIGVETVEVDGQPMAVRFPDESVAFGRSRKRRIRRNYKPGAQIPLALKGVRELHSDLRLSALSALDGEPPALSGDVLALLSLIYATEQPLYMHETEIAAHLARSEDGGYRDPEKSDIRRAWEAAAELYGLCITDPDGTGRWVNLATVEPFPMQQSIQFSRPEWARWPDVGQFTLTTQGGLASRARVVAGSFATSGRIITGIETYAYTRFDGRPGIPELLRPERKGGAGPFFNLSWREILQLGGYEWDRSDPKQTDAQLKRFHRTTDRMREAGYTVLDMHGEARAGDAIELVAVLRGGGRGRQPGLKLRTSARFCEAARKAILADGKGFETRSLADWTGFKLDMATGLWRFSN